MSPDWPKRSTPRARTRWRPTAPSQDSVAGWPSMTVTRPASGGRRASSRSTCDGVAVRLADARSRPASRRAAGRARSRPAGRRRACPRGSARARRSPRAPARRHRRSPARRPAPARAASSRRRRPASASACVDRPLRLGERPGRQAQIDRAAVLRLHVPEAPGHDGRQLVDIGRLEAGRARPGRCRSAACRPTGARRLPAPGSGPTASPPA